MIKAKINLLLVQIRLFFFGKNKREIIQKFLLALIVLFALISVGFLLWINHMDFKNAMVKQGQVQLLSIARSEAQSIEKYILNINRELEILATEYPIHASFLTGRGKQQYSRFLDSSYRNIEKLVDGIYLINQRGVIIDASPYREGVVGRDLSYLPDVNYVMNNYESYTSKIFKTPSGQQVIASLQPIFESGKFIGMIRAVILMEKINLLLGHINDIDKVHAVVIDKRQTLLSYPDIRYIGKDILSIKNNVSKGKRDLKFENILFRVRSRQAGAGVVNFLSLGYRPRNVKSLIAYTPIRVEDNLWSMIVVMDYNVIAAPINKNIRDNFFLAGLLCLLFTFLVGYIYRGQQKKAELAITAASLNIINKQLHLELDERRRIEKELHESLHARRKPPGQAEEPDNKKSS